MGAKPKHIPGYIYFPVLQVYLYGYLDQYKHPHAHKSKVCNA
eukprot:NODE_5472_length_507_cov_235.871179_g4079_i0.p4 GENE.NODE_5472_length_507_cov_235.871179_g4079_i0~~NODE_5472_length_507_cov_235.871179_g4079_i0.p4  ORF type:complete len:52 (-),score=4.52 NODE_5472_length_507_cov_235.871179_g4079_i0:350-475(-)